MYLFAKIYPSAIPGHSFPISNLMASLKEIVKNTPSRVKTMLWQMDETDGRTDTQMQFFEWRV